MPTCIALTVTTNTSDALLNPDPHTLPIMDMLCKPSMDSMTSGPYIAQTAKQKCGCQNGVSRRHNARARRLNSTCGRQCLVRTKVLESVLHIDSQPHGQLPQRCTYLDTFCCGRVCAIEPNGEPFLMTDETASWQPNPGNNGCYLLCTYGKCKRKAPTCLLWD